MTATEELLKKIPVKYVSPETAFDLAKMAYQRALFLHFQTQIAKESQNSVTSTFVDSARKVIGVGCTAAISTDRERKGHNHAYIGIYGSEGYRTYDLVMEKGTRDREGEERLVSSVIIGAIIDHVLDKQKEDDKRAYDEYYQHLNSLLHEGEKITTSLQSDAQKSVLTQQFFENESSVCGLYYNANPTDPNSLKFEMGDDIQTLFTRPYKGSNHIFLIYSGSYNPIHTGHYTLFETAIRIVSQKFNKKVVPLFDLGILNADKNSLDEKTVRSRLELFKEPMETAVLLSKAPLFLRKAKLFPGAWFLIGVDTVIRLIDKKYYNNSESDLMEALATFYECGTKFVVGGRKMGDKFVVLSNVILPKGFERMFIEISEDEFRVDLSSTEIRERQKLQ